MHWLQRGVVVLATGLLGLAGVSGVAATKERQVDDLDQALTTVAVAQQAALDEYFERARTIDLLLADNPAFAEFLAAPGDRLDKLRAGGPRVQKLADALGYLEELYPDAIGEACFIDRTGAEMARVVRGEAAPLDELSEAEEGAPFFDRVMALAPGQVFQSQPYVSPDTGEWVVSTSTPLALDGRMPEAVVHFEIALASFAQAADVPPGHGLQIVDRLTGLVVADSRRPVTGARDLARADGPLAALVEDTRGGVTASGDLGGRRGTALALTRSATNANDWVVVVSASPVSLGLHSLGVAPVAMSLGAAMLFVLAWTQHRVNRRALRRASLHDELTGLPNRRLLGDRLGQALRLADRRSERCGVLVLDLDRFKEINDTLGHAYGDLLLQQLAVRLTGVLREQDTLARLGGDEFALLLPGVGGADDAVAAARRVLAAISEPFVVHDVTLDVECSIGVALAPDHGRDADVLMRCADVAMYEAKEATSGVEVYDPDRDTNTPLRLALLGDLRRALDTDELYLDYQPKVALASGELSGVEALLRWRHPVRGLVSPGEFIPVAEGTGLIHRLTMRTLELAVGQAAAWAGQGRPLQVAVNLSARLLLDEDLPAVVGDLLRRHDLPPRLLRLELTESAVMTDPARALQVLQALRDVGVYLSIDDFGTGYSSMAYLKRLPVDELKVDRSFVMDMQANDSDAVLVRSAIDLGHNLGLTVVAEGVEDAGTLEALGGLGCDVIQGFHLARPMSPEQVDRWRAAQDDHQPAGAQPAAARPPGPTGCRPVLAAASGPRPAAARPALPAGAARRWDHPPRP